MEWQPASWELETDRLRLVSWRRRGDALLIDFLTAELTEAVTRGLPPSWQGGVTRATAADWIEERDREGLLFLVEQRADSAPVGLFMFYPGAATLAVGEVRVGYVLAEPAWGRGFATEILRGFLGQWDRAGATAVLLAGVTEENRASQRVLEKCGFARVGARSGVLDYRRTR